jgi:uncharacterized membrane protein
MWLTLWIISWVLFAAGVMWFALGTRRIHPDAALLIRAVLTLLLIAGVIFMMLALQPTHY